MSEFHVPGKYKPNQVIEHDLLCLGKLDKMLKIVAADYGVHYSSFNKRTEGFTDKLSLQIMLSKDGWNRNLVIDGRVCASDISFEFINSCEILNIPR